MVLKKVFSNLSSDVNLVMMNGKHKRKGVNKDSTAAISSLVIPLSMSFNLYVASIEQKHI